jgi:lysophospholipase L1-like esterase
MTRLAGRLTLVLLGIAIALGIAEGTLRVLAVVRPPEDLRGLHEPRPDRPWLFGLRPGAQGRVRHTGNVRYVINADGFRDQLRPRAKPPGTFRIVVMGDSIAFGYGVSLDDSFPKRLEQRLAARAPAQPIQVLNLGVNGYNPYTEAALFADVGVRYQPDLVLVEFCINDLNDPTMHFDTQTVLQLPDIPDLAFPDPARRRTAQPPSLVARACAHSRLCMLVRNCLTPLQDSATLAAGLQSHDDPSAGEIAWLRERYADMARAAYAVGARFAVIVFPYATQVDGRVADTVERRIAAAGDEAGWNTIDLLPAFLQGARDGTGPLFIDLWHPNDAGHRVAADALAAELACRGLVPVPAGPDCPAVPGSTTHGPVREPIPRPSKPRATMP